MSIGAKLILIWCVIGISLALFKFMSTKSEKRKLSKIEKQDALAGKLLAIYSVFIGAGVSVSEVVFGAIRTLYTTYKPFVICVFLLFLVAFVFLVVSIFLNEDTTKVPEGDEMSAYLLRKKAKYNLISVYFFLIGILLFTIISLVQWG